MRIKTVLNNCIYKILENNEFKNIYIYGSQNLELEKFISKITSSSILGGDVDFYNALLGCYYNKHEISDSKIDEIKKIFDIEKDLSDIEYIAYCLVYRDYKKIFVDNNIHFERLRKNILQNKEQIIDQMIKQIDNHTTNLNNFHIEDFEDFCKRINDDDLLVVDTRHSKLKVGANLPKNVILISNKELHEINNSFKVVRAKDIYVYSNLLLHNEIYSRNKKQIYEKSKIETTTSDAVIDEVKIMQLPYKDFNILRKRYLGKTIHFLGMPKVCYGIFNQDNKLIGAFALTNDYRNKTSKEIEDPYIYLLSDFTVNTNIKHLSKLVLNCILSKEVKLLSERLINKEVKTIVTNVFTKNAISMKYRDDFILSERKKLYNGYNDLTYYSQSGKWTLKEGLEKWKQKL